MNAPSRLEASAVQHGEAADEPPRRYRVLIADDQPEHLEMIARAIERSDVAASVDLVRAGDGFEAWEHVQSGVDLAFLDIRMPGCSGLDVVARVRGDPHLAALPVVIVSSSSDPRDVQQADSLGVSAYVEKGRFGPFRQRIQDILSAFINGQPL